MIEIRSNGRIINGFTSVSITKSLDQISASYTISLFGSDKESAWIPVFPGDEVEIAIDGEVVIKGYNVTSSPSINNSGSGCQVAGLEKTCDLVDCVSKTLFFENKKVDEIVRIICADFGLNFNRPNGVDFGTPMNKFSADIGSSALNVIVNACKERNLYPVSDGLGNVSIIGSHFESAEVDIVQGGNVISAAGNFSVADRFSKYTIYSSRDAKGKTFASIEDEEVTRSREFVLVDERFATKENCESRAIWEAKHRAADGNSLNVIVNGWRQGEGSLWKPGILVNCEIPSIIGEPRTFLVNRVTFSFGLNGSQTSLELVDEDIYLPQPKIAPKGKVKKKQKDTWESVRKQTGSKLK